MSAQSPDRSCDHSSSAEAGPERSQRAQVWRARWSPRRSGSESIRATTARASSKLRRSICWCVLTKIGYHRRVAMAPPVRIREVAGRRRQGRRIPGARLEPQSSGFLCLTEVDGRVE